MDTTQFLLIVIIGLEVGILFGIRRIYAIEEMIERLEEKIVKKKR